MSFFRNTELFDICISLLYFYEVEIIAVELITKAIFQSAFHSEGKDGREAERKAKEEMRESKLIPGLKRICQQRHSSF